MRAGLSQKDVAERLDVTQGQASRYESFPANAPFRIVASWLEACGVSLETALRDTEAEESATSGLDAGTPYKRLQSSLALLEQYILQAPSPPEGIPIPFNPKQLLHKVSEWGRKPNVMIAGRFDSGKTKLANTLLGSNELPSEFTPTTTVVTFIRHLVEDRPRWQKEEVWMMDGQFDPINWQDEEYCKQHKVIAGSFDTLRKFGTKISERERRDSALGDYKEAKFALVYMNAPILRSCAIVDLPGYEDEEILSALSSSVAMQADVLLYTSPANGFLDIRDRQYLGMFLRLLLATPELCESSLSLRRLLVIASHASKTRFPDDKLDGIIVSGSERMFSTLEDMLSNAGIKSTDLLSRMFSFWFEERSRRDHLESELSKLLGSVLPKFIENTVESQIKEIKNDSKSHFAIQIAAFERARAEIDSADQRLNELLEEQEAFTDRIDRSIEVVKRTIEGCQSATDRFIRTNIFVRLDVERVEAFIRKHYDDSRRDEARMDAIAKLLESIQTEVELEISKESSKIKVSVEQFLDSISSSHLDTDLKSNARHLSIPVDVRAAFVGGITGVGLTSAASVILSLKAGLTLSVLGFGSTALAAFVMTIGGPITIAIGLSSFASLAVWSMVRESWQKRLARKIVRTLEDQNLIDKLLTESAKYWQESRKAFVRRAEEVKTNFDTYIEKLDQLLSAQNLAEIEQILAKLEELKGFFANIPWKLSE